MRGRAVQLLVAVIVSITGCGRAPAGPADPSAATVVRIIDGDTVVVRVQQQEETVRLIGIDTPETHKPDTPVECYGVEATEFLASLVPPDTSLRLVRDVEARDRYDRLLAYVYRADDGLFVNLELVEEGYAAVLTIPPNVAHSDEFVAAASSARKAARGLWAACGGGHSPLVDAPEAQARSP
jgi:micrococcal nuclease